MATTRRPSRPTTVLFAAGAEFYSGAERALLLTLKSLDPSRYRPVVAVGTRGRFLDEVRSAGIDAEHIPIVRTDWRTVGSWMRSVLALTRLGARCRARLLHANEAPTFQPLGHAARLLGVPALTHVRFTEIGAAYGWYLKARCARSLFVSDYLRSHALAEAPHVFRDHAEVLYDGVELVAQPAADEWVAGRRRLGIDPDVPAVVLSGQVVEIKGIWEYIEAARLIARRGIPATFVVLGDDLAGNGLTRVMAEQKVRALGLSDRFRFLGFRPNANRLIEFFDIVAAPSHVEPLGNTVLEAMAAARPVVGSRVGGIPEMVVEGVTGLLVPPRDAQALADSLCLLLQDGSRRESLGHAGRRRAAECFSLEAHAARLQATYDGLLGRLDQQTAIRETVGQPQMGT